MLLLHNMRVLRRTYIKYAQYAFRNNLRINDRTSIHIHQEASCIRTMLILQSCPLYPVRIRRDSHFLQGGLRIIQEEAEILNIGSMIPWALR